MSETYEQQLARARTWLTGTFLLPAERAALAAVLARLKAYENALKEVAHLLERFPEQAVLVRDGEFVKGAQPMCAIRKAAAAYRRTRIALASRADARGTK